MANSYSYLPYKETGYFSHLVNDYLIGNEHINPFSNYQPDAAGLAAAIEERCNYPVNRQLLVATLKKQYAQLPPNQKTEENIHSLLRESTFTVCTAHQPNLLTGYLYFIYKILHAIKMAEELNKLHPGNFFVPVYYMGSEDNDIEELGQFSFRGEKYVWDGDGQHGAVGRMKTKELKNLLHTLFNTFGPPGKNCDDLQTLVTDAYLQHRTVAEATQYLVHELFGRFGLIILNPDDTAFKASFSSVMRDELLNKQSYTIVSTQIEKLAVHYKIQAHPRELNLFYLADNLRERIEKRGDRWSVVNTDIQWDQAGILDELDQHPERFSPNVVLRGLFQETILPNVAFIGGGAEVAYWLQLKTLFEHYKVFYPCIYLRQSVLWITEKNARLRKQLDFSIRDIFKPELDLARCYIQAHTTTEWHTDEETKAIETIFNSLKEKATTLDPTLAGSAEAVMTRMKYQLTLLEKKMLRAEKKKMQTEVLRIERLKRSLFPGNSLQERVENFSEYYLEYGPGFFDVIKDGINALDRNFLVIE